MTIPIGQIKTGPSSGGNYGGGSSWGFFVFVGHVILGGLIWHWTDRWYWAALYWSWPIVLGIITYTKHPPQKYPKVRDTSGRYS